MKRGAAPSGLAMVVRPPRAEASLWRRLRYEAQAECREPLFNLYVGLARAIARRQWRRRGRLDREDFEQFAFEALLQAIDRYDPLRGVGFGVFAGKRIAGNVADGVARLTEVEAQLGHRRRMERERLQSLGAADEDPLDALSALVAGLALGILLEREDAPDPGPSAYESLAWRELQARIAAEIGRLPEREQQVVRQHYQNGLSFSQVAVLLELSRGRVSQLHRSAIERLRRRLGGIV